MRIIQESRRVQRTIYNRSFNFKGYVGWGYTFECDQEGNTKLFSMSDPGQQNYLSCLLGRVQDKDVDDDGIFSWISEYQEPTIGLCNVCNKEVVLCDNTNTCEHCGTDYNWGGQQLAPRECWGEETGEHWSECV